MGSVTSSGKRVEFAVFSPISGAEGVSRGRRCCLGEGFPGTSRAKATVLKAVEGIALAVKAQALSE